MSPSKRASDIFHYAKTEFSQDAMICWLVGCIHHKDPLLRDCGIAFVRALFRSGDVSVLDPKTMRKAAYPGPCEVQRLLDAPSQQRNNIDVYFRASIDCKTVSFIIEDKVESTVHDNQLSRYLLKVATDSTREQLIKPVYFKTGYVSEEEEKYVHKRKYSVFDLSTFVNFFYGKSFLRRLDSGEGSLLWGYRTHILGKNRQREREFRELLSGNTERLSNEVTLNRFALRLRDELSQNTSWIPSINFGMTWEQPANKKKYGPPPFSWTRNDLKARMAWTEVRQHKTWSEAQLWFCNEFFWTIERNGRVSLKRDFGDKGKSDRELCQRYHDAFVRAVDLLGGRSEKTWSFRTGQKCTIGSVQLDRQQTPQSFIERFSAVQAEFLRRIPPVT